MIVLAMDTCLGACQAALLDGGAVRATLSEPMTRGHQERLAPMVRELMALADVSFAGVDKIVATVGPGSFTGLRVGVAFAKGLALALGKPLVGVGTLEALAALEEGSRAAAIDAGRGRVYLQGFDLGERLAAPHVTDLAALAAGDADTPPERLIGPGAPLLAAIWPEAVLDSRRIVDIGAVARLGEARAANGAAPLYLRPADAVPKAQRAESR